MARNTFTVPRSLIGAVAGLVFLASGCGSKPTLLTVIQNFNQQNYPKVVEQCRVLIADNPDDIQAHRYLIRASKKLATLEDLEKEYRQQTVAEPQNATAAFGLGYSLVQKQQFADALIELQRAQNLNENLEYVNYVLGWLHFNPLAPMYDPAQAHEFWAHETQLDPASMGALQVYIDLGNFYKEHGEFELARQQFRQFRDNAFSEGDRVEARNLLDKLKASELDVVRIEQAAMNEAATYEELRAWGERLIRWERAKDAIPYLERATQLEGAASPDSEEDQRQKAQAYNYLGMALMLDEQNPEALKAFHQAVELEPDLAEAYYNLGFLNDALEDWDGALSAYNKYLELLSFSEQAEKVRARVDEIRAAQAAGATGGAGGTQVEVGEAG